MDLRVNSADAVLPPEELSPELQPDGCKSTTKSPGKCDKTEWIEHLAKQCKIPTKCSQLPRPIRFKSFVDPTGHGVILDDLTRHTPTP
jgi:hypothetical protein